MKRVRMFVTLKVKDKLEFITTINRRHPSTYSLFAACSGSEF
jgi:hypothetical protein